LAKRGYRISAADSIKLTLKGRLILEGESQSDERFISPSEYNTLDSINSEGTVDFKSLNRILMIQYGPKYWVWIAAFNRLVDKGLIEADSTKKFGS